jgi:translation initiation factor 6
VDVNGNPYVGVVCTAAEDLVLVPNEARDEHVELISETLEVPPVRMTVGGTNLLGTMVAMNSVGAVVGDIINDDELEVLSKHREVLILHGRLNCAGNLVLANDEHAWVHPRLGDDVREDIAGVLDVDVGEGDLAGMGVVGSVGRATNRGVLVHPKARKEEIEALKGFFGVHVDIGTLNYGSPMIGACCVANSKGAVTGTASTGIELGRLEDALGLIE